MALKSIISVYGSHIPIFNVYGILGGQNIENTNLDDTLMNPHPRVRHLQLPKHFRVLKRDAVYVWPGRKGDAC